MSLLDTEDLVHFIARNYEKAGKIVEVGVGIYPWVAKSIKELLPNARVIVTDTDGEKLSYAKAICPEIEAVYDNAFNPQPTVYAGSDLIYSMRPPTELVSEIFKLASKVGCDVLIRPYSDEEGGYSYLKRHGWQLTAYGRATFYWLKREGSIMTHNY